MASVGNWWIASHELRAGEELLWEGKGMQVSPTGSMVGGKLFLTDQRLLFSPHLVERLFLSDKAAFELSDIRSVAAGGDAFEGEGEPVGPLKHLFVIDLPGGEDERFAVTDEEAIDRLRDLVGRDDEP